MRTPPQTAGDWPTLAAAGSVEEIRDALEGGAQIDATDTQGRTAILIAAKANRLDVVRLLIAAGADIDAQDQVNLNPFLWGCISGNLDLVTTMVEAGADLDRHTRFDGVGIHPAAEKGHVEIVRYLAEQTDINVNYTNLCGWTPLLEAIILRDGGPAQQEIVRLLLAAGADPAMVDQWGVSPLAHAQEKGFAELADLLQAALA
ncbi:MAG: ankyrin repeat domain-containing protein [Tessaracoccus sp.]|uniref:ankyrin repeat domain-containing protein n=1 Tax=Tessaracoccus sp. TaxID=1971211 RepID=UPI001ED7CA57|nr:ankyrin repeat domain-containing protein [Tessaracoccus sp.]MBK7821010.1 ankyrin repeat domain-containing protein [Tessaracoccus sp.]